MSLKLGAYINWWLISGSIIITSKSREEVWRHVIMVALFLDDNKTNNEGDGKEIGKKWYVYFNKNNFARASLYFVHFFAAAAQLPHETS